MAQFAMMVGTTTATISRIANGTVTPRRDLLVRIHERTGGLVTPNDLTGLHCQSGRCGQWDEHMGEVKE